MIPIVAVVGPTASGKTAFGIALAKRLNGEIISCDSMQIYRGLDIGTAKPSAQELAAVPHHLIGFLDQGTAFSVSDYVLKAEKAIEEIRDRGRLPVLVGGTGLYARSLLSGLSFAQEGRDDLLREKLTEQVEKEGADALHQRLVELDPAAAQSIHPNNIKRVVRALEFCLVTGKRFSDQIEASKPSEPKYRYHMFCLTHGNREHLYEKINRRVDMMLENGLLEEAESLYRDLSSGNAFPTALQAIGYKELFPYFEGKITIEEAAERIKQSTRRYAKRQLTWFRREDHIDFLDLDEMTVEEALEQAEKRLAEQGIGK